MPLTKFRLNTIPTNHGIAACKTGAILAMAQRPTFNPNTKEGINDNWQNIIVENAFEPGSTMKIFTLASAIEEGVFNPNELYQSGEFKVKGSPSIYDHNNVGWGAITFLEGIQKSSNVAVSNLVKKMGTETYRQYLEKFKFGQPTGINLQNEASGTIQYQYERDKYATSYGQATSVTVLQMIQAMTAITNDGKMMKPYLVEKIVDENGQIVKNSDREEVAAPISAETAKQVLEILESTVTDGTGKNYKIDGYRVAGKTGTAQIYEHGKGYLKGWDNYLFSFIGTAPVEEPEIIVYVLVKKPDLDDKTYESGSIPVSKIFKPVMKNSLQYLNIKPDESVEPVKTNVLPDVVSKNVDAAISVIENSNLEPIVIGDGKTVLATVPERNSQMMDGEKVMLVTDGHLKMPDILVIADVMKLVNAANIQFTFEGEGYVASQNIKPEPY